MPAILKSPNLSSEWSLCGENPKFTVMAEIEPNTQSIDLNLVSRVEELKALTFFTSKTSVWDHIKGSLYYKRSCNLSLPCPVLGIHKASDFDTKSISVTTQLSKKLDNTKPIKPSVNFSKTSIQRPMEDVHSSRLPCVRSLGWNPEIMTSFRVLFSTEPFRNSSNDNMWTKRLFSEPTSHSEVPLIQRKFADVRLKELGIWLGDQSPKSPREFGTVLKQGWQWYYTKYIDIRRGGIGGISLLLAGYCVLCYIWRYPDLKKERWRKYH
ncbi:uncharacterized protein si:dkey-21c1.4 [Triplophysa dalaica]|uniref:uncharacterized protein si:dkey-21c1.4 n=1 Tax=Triplophysa dalaica TaxID=1582913 RepID=UPI0024DFC82B|nr:uncharacterized protein si:dkey-21c1.4 [Triplophysa dalaica]